MPDRVGIDGADSHLERELALLGRTMQAQEEADSQPADPEFVRSLRARLVGEAAPADVQGQSIDLGRERHRRRPYWVVAPIAVIAAAVLVVLIGTRQGPGQAGRRHVG